MFVEDGCWKEETAKENEVLFVQTMLKCCPIMENTHFLVEIQWLTKPSLIPSQQIQLKPIHQLPTVIIRSAGEMTPGQPRVLPNLEIGTAQMTGEPSQRGLQPKETLPITGTLPFIIPRSAKDQQLVTMMTVVTPSRHLPVSRIQSQPKQEALNAETAVPAEAAT